MILAPCPECGNQPRLNSLEPEYPQMKFFCGVHCSCGDWKETKELAEIDWNNRVQSYYKDLDNEREQSDTITLKRIYSTHCQVCSDEFGFYNDPIIVYFVPAENNICCHQCAIESGYSYEPRIYKEGE